MAAASDCNAGRVGDPTEEELGIVDFALRRVARRLPPGVDLDDLRQEALVAAVACRAAWRPDGASYRTYCEHRVRGAILDALRDMDEAPRSFRQFRRTVERARWLESQRLRREATEEEVAIALGLTPRRLFERGSASSTHRVSRLVPGADGRIVDVIEEAEDPAAVDPVAVLEAADLERVVGEAVDALPDLERAVVQAYYYGGLPQGVIGALLGVTESRACQLLNKAYRRLRLRLGRQEERA